MVYFFKLSTGEEILAEGEPNMSDFIWKLKNPVRIILTKEGVTMFPYNPFIEKDEIEIRSQFVVYTGEVTVELQNAYNSKFGSGVLVTNSGNLKLHV